MYYNRIVLLYNYSVMKLPAVMKVILNIIFYIIYSLIALILVSFASPLIFNHIIENGSKEANIITAIVMVLVLFITIIFRKYFYISCNKDEK